MYPYSHQHLADELRTAVEAVITDPREHTFWKAKNILAQMEGAPEEQRSRAIRAAMNNPTPGNIGEVQSQLEASATQMRRSIEARVGRTRRDA